MRLAISEAARPVSSWTGQRRDKEMDGSLWKREIAKWERCSTFTILKLYCEIAALSTVKLCMVVSGSGLPSLDFIVRFDSPLPFLTPWVNQCDLYVTSGLGKFSTPKHAEFVHQNPSRTFVTSIHGT